MRYFVFVFLIILILLILFLKARLPVLTGYSAKALCSCLFVAERDVDGIIKEDLNFFPIKYTKSKIDYEKKTVTSTVFGFGKSKAIYREGLGCTNVVGFSESEIYAQPFTPAPILPQRPDTLAWPNGDLVPDSIPPGLNKALLDQAIKQAFIRPEEKTRAVLVLYKNQLVGEQYGLGFDQNTRQLGWSMTKSITNALIGILVQKGQLDKDAPAPIEEWRGTPREKITLNNLLQMSSGLKWSENYADLSSVTRMLYKKGDMATFSCAQKQKQEPGSFYLYSSGTTNILQRIIQDQVGDQQKYLNFARTALFNKIGMRSAIMEPDASGTMVGSSYAYATPRDWARFGLLYLNDGLWDNKRILPEDWVDYTRSPAPASGGIYGAQFWLKDPESIPDAPDDLYMADGFQGQRVYIIPSRSLVIVRMGVTKEGDFDFNQFLKEILAAVE